MKPHSVEHMNAVIKAHEDTLARLKEQRAWALRVLELAPAMGLPEKGADISLEYPHGIPPSVKWTAMKWQRIKGHAVCGNGHGHVTLTLKDGRTHWRWGDYSREATATGISIPPGVLDYIQSKAELFGDLGETRDA